MKKTHAASRLPKTRAKTAYELLGEIRRVILAVPARYAQSEVLYRLKPGTPIHVPDGYASALIRVPACGTVGCRAGWAVELTRVRTQGGVMDTAQRLLGLTRAQAAPFFRGSAVAGRPGTRAHAQAGARGITAFMRAHRAQLQATRLADWRTRDGDF
jgi:hypothetical protein